MQHKWGEMTPRYDAYNVTVRLSGQPGSFRPHCLQKRASPQAVSGSWQRGQNQTTGGSGVTGPDGVTDCSAVATGKETKRCALTLEFNPFVTEGPTGR